jgi:hypothetical protein
MIVLEFSLSGRQAGIGAFLVVDYFPSRLDFIEPYRSASYEQLGGFYRALKKLLMVTVRLSLI